MPEMRQGPTHPERRSEGTSAAMLGVWDDSAEPGEAVGNAGAEWWCSGDGEVEDERSESCGHKHGRPLWGLMEGGSAWRRGIGTNKPRPYSRAGTAEGPTLLVLFKRSRDILESER